MYNNTSDLYSIAKKKIEFINLKIYLLQFINNRVIWNILITYFKAKLLTKQNNSETILSENG